MLHLRRQGYFSEVSPRPHDTGLVTIGSQMWTEFALHARAILGLPVPPIRLLRPACSVAILGEGNGVPHFSGLDKALAVPESHIRLFGKPECKGHRRLAVAVASGDTLEEARERARLVASQVKVSLD
jgi:phosphoribosylglycinamide formyltransferase 2